MNYLKYCGYRKISRAKGRIKLSPESFFYPGILLPLTYLERKTSNLTYIFPSYSDTFESLKVFGSGYFPAVPLPKLGTEIDSIFPHLYSVLEDGKKCGGQDAFKYIIGELGGNIVEHSESQNAYIMGYAYSKKKFTEVCLFDDGISIPGAFEKHGVTYEDDSKAIALAIKGKSTSEEGGRGFGLGTSLAMLVEGLNGEVLLISRRGGFYADSDGVENYELESPLVSHMGTIITMRIPFQDKKLDPYLFTSGAKRLL